MFFYVILSLICQYVYNIANQTQSRVTEPMRGNMRVIVIFVRYIAMHWSEGECWK